MKRHILGFLSTCNMSLSPVLTISISSFHLPHCLVTAWATYVHLFQAWNIYYKMATIMLPCVFLPTKMRWKTDTSNGNQPVFVTTLDGSVGIGKVMWSGNHLLMWGASLQQPLATSRNIREHLFLDNADGIVQLCCLKIFFVFFGIIFKARLLSICFLHDV